MRPVVLLCAVLLAGCPPSAQPARCAELDTEHVVAGLQAWLDGTKSLQADFRQSLVSGALGASASESGRLYLERPGKLRWDYKSPERKVAMLIGDRTSLYLEEDRQLIRGRLSSEQALFPRLLTGQDQILALFAPGLVATPRSGGAGSYRLRLVPKSAPDGVSVITLVLAPPSLAIEGAEVLDEAGNRTIYLLRGMVRNGPSPEGIFAFEPPPGTEVLDQP